MKPWMYFGLGVVIGVIGYMIYLNYQAKKVVAAVQTATGTPS